tara:strand:+ start:10254 stop:10748 length:495 start_codon:yes stop_codon:yes gene_type:complete
MPFISAFPMIALIMSGSVLASGSVLTKDTKNINQTNLYGSWNCKGAMQHKQLKMGVKFDYNIHFKKDFKSTGEGLVSFTIPNFSALDYQLSDNSTWKIDNDEIIYASNDLKLINVSHPELAKIINLEKLMPETINESSKILLLTKTKLEVQAKVDNKIYSCTKQ